jgi:Xaa-Pro aminopeptidase
MARSSRSWWGVLALGALASAAFGARAQDPPALVRARGDQDAMTERAFSPERCRARRKALLERLGPGALVVLFSGKDEGGDARRHRAGRDFLYLTGIDEPACWVVLDGLTEQLYAQPAQPGAEIWTGEHVVPGEKTARRYGFDFAYSKDVLKQNLAHLQSAARKVWVAGLPPNELRNLEVFDDQKIINNARSDVGWLRQVKDDAEVALMKRAAEISATAFHACARAIAPDRFEFEVQGLFEGCCRFHGAEDQGYPSIVGSGPNSCVLHYDKDRRRMKSGDLIVLDAAAESGFYSADVTRTFPVSGRFTPEQRRVYEAVLKAQDAGIAACRPGVTVRDVHAAAAAVLKQEGLGQYLPHGVSHWLGLDVHDSGDYSRPLEPGMVLTVEPGCYIAAQELGVRIEDDILVTEDGPVNLSAYAPRTVEDVEALLARSKQASEIFPPLPPETPLPELRKHRGKLY